MTCQDVPEGNNTLFARSLNRIKVGLSENQVASSQPHPTLGGSFPYKPGDAVYFLGSKGRIGLGCIAEICGSKYRSIHSGTKSTILANDNISPTEKTKRAHAKSAALNPVLKTIRDKSVIKVSFKISTKIYRPKRSCRY